MEIWETKKKPDERIIVPEYQWQQGSMIIANVQSLNADSVAAQDELDSMSAFRDAERLTIELDPRVPYTIVQTECEIIVLLREGRLG